MRKFGVCLALTGASFWLTGCGFFGGQSSTPSSSSRGGVAVVDLDKVAAETGKSQEMRESLEMTENSYKQELAQFQAQATAKLQAKIDDLKSKGDEATDEAKRDAVNFKVDATNKLTQAQNLAGAKLGEIRQNQIAKFRTELKPIIQEVMAKRGMSVVIPKNEGLLLSVDPGVDITDDVIKGYRAAKPAAAPAKETAAKAAEKKTASREESKN